MLRVRAGQVHPITAPPIEDGAVLVGDDGRITAIGPHLHIPTPLKCETLEFRDSVLVPGLVNAHTHLELTHLAGRNDESEFPRWILRVRDLKMDTPPGAFDAAAEAGVRECWAQGVTCVADTGDSGAALRALQRLGGRGIAYHEVFGPDPAQSEDSLAGLIDAVGALRRHGGRLAMLGVSPHAPYSVSAPLYKAVAEFAEREGLPIAVHLAESREETALVRDGAGPFAEMLRKRGITVTAQGRSPVEYLDRLGVLGPQTLAIHCVQIDGADVKTLATSGAAVAHCPLSNRAHGHGAAPLAALRAAGVKVGIGTDSVVSVGTPDLWAECAAAGLAGDDALRMLTLDGARALGLDRQIGSLEVGKEGDFAVLSDYPSNRLTVRLTALAGRVVHRA
jgi:5-methylthioadenosine/S-adenosylhomocysteine deaminase